MACTSSHRSMLGRAKEGFFGTDEGVGSQSTNTGVGPSIPPDVPAQLSEGQKFAPPVCPAGTSAPAQGNRPNTGFDNVDVLNIIEMINRLTMSDVNAAISAETKIALAQLSRSRRGVAAATRSTDPLFSSPEFQELRETWAIRALKNLRLQTETETVSQFAIETSPEWLHNDAPLPPTPSRRSQEGGSNQSGDGHHEPPTTDSAEWCEDMIDRVTNRSEERDEEATAGEGSLIVHSEGTQGKDSPGSDQVYTEEELVIFIRKIFWGDDNKGDVMGWCWDGAPPAAIDHPGEQRVSHTDTVDQQGEESDIGEESGEGEGKLDVASPAKCHGLFGPSSSTSRDDENKVEKSHPHAHEHAEVMQGVLEQAAAQAAAHSATGAKSPENDTPPITITSTLTASPKSLCATLCSSSPAQRTSLPPENRFETHSSEEAASVRSSKPGNSLKVNVIVDGYPPDIIPVLATQVNPLELEPRKPPVATTSEEVLQCSTIGHMIRKKHLPEFGPTQPGIFSASTLVFYGNAPTRKRKRSRGDDEDEERASNPSSQQCDREVLLPGASKRPRFEENSRGRSPALLALIQPPEPSPVKRRTGSSGSPPQFQVYKSGLFNKMGSRSRPPLQ